MTASALFSADLHPTMMEIARDKLATYVERWSKQFGADVPSQAHTYHTVLLP